MSSGDKTKLEHAFLDYAKNRDWKTVAFMARETPSLCVAHPAGRWSALHHAASAGKSEIVSLLLEYKADANLKSGDGRSPADLASNAEIQKLLSDGVELGANRVELEHKFLDVAKGKNWNELKHMIAQIPALVVVQPAGRWSALHWASSSGREDLIDLLLAHSADVNAKASDGKSPVDVAANDVVRRKLGAPEVHSESARSTVLEAFEVLSSDDESKLSGKRAEEGDAGKPSAKRPCLEKGAPACASEPVVLSSISVPEGKYMLTTSKTIVAKGAYLFDKSTRQVSAKGQGVIGTFLDQQVSLAPFPEAALADPWNDSPVHLACVRIVVSEIIEEIQSPANAGAFFVLPSQLNGAEYPSENVIVAHIDQYKLDRTGGPRGQLAVHPAAGQFVLNNAASDKRLDGINAIDEVLKRMPCVSTGKYKMRLKNGYLGLPDCPPSLQAEVLHDLRSSLHCLRCLCMEGVPACGLAPSLEEASTATHNVSLVYASAVPVQAYLNYQKKDGAFQEEVSRLAISAQYYGALRLAASRATKESPMRVFVMPLGGGVFNNRSETIAGSISIAIELLHHEGWDVSSLLDIRVLAFKGKPSEGAHMADLMGRLQKLIA